MTCKDCIHEKVCQYKRYQVMLSDVLYEESDNVERIGCPFADKSKVVEVVRCRDCKCYDKTEAFNCSFVSRFVEADDFCSYGERKDEAEKTLKEQNDESEHNASTN